MEKKKSKTLLISAAVGIVVLVVALLCLTRCAKKDDSWQTQYDLGIRLLSEGNYEEAILAFKNAIEIDPKKADGYIGLADVYLAMEEPQPAVDVLMQGLEAVDETQERAKLEAKLEEINREYFSDENPETEPGGEDETAADGDDENVFADGDDPTSDPVIMAMEESIAAVYDYAGPFKEGRALVGLLQEDGSMKYFFIDTEGNVVSDEYDMAKDFSEGLAVVGRKGTEQIDTGYSTYDREYYLYGYIDTTGAEVIPLQYKGDGGDVSCRSFHNGYAEVIWWEENSEFYFYTNLIDYSGNKVVPVDQKGELGYGYFEESWNPDVLDLIESDTDYLGWNFVQRALCQAGMSFPVVIYDGNQSYWIDENLAVINTNEGYVTEYGDVYVVVPEMETYDVSNKGYMMDAAGNVLADGFVSMYESSRGYMVADIARADENGIYIGESYYRIYSKDGAVMLDNCGYFTEYDGGYIISHDKAGTEMLKYTVLDENFNELFTTTCTYISSTSVHWGGDSVNELFAVSVYDTESGRNQMEYVDMNGNTVFPYIADTTLAAMQGGYVARSWSDHTVIYYVDGQEICEIQGLSNVGDASYYEVPGYTMVIYGTFEGEYGFWGIALADGSAVLNKLEFDDSSYTVYDPENVEFKNLVLAQNGQSQINGTGRLEDDVILTKDGVLIFEGKAASLISNNLYKEARTLLWNDETWTYDACDVTLHTVDGSWSSETYEQMGVLSENFISFCVDGKWGYLQVK